MKKILLMSSLLLLVACSAEGDNNKEEKSANSSEESTQLEKDNEENTTVVEKNFFMTQSDIEGKYKYTDDEKSTEVTFEDGGTLRVRDGSGNLRYYINESYGRLVIGSVIYRTDKLENGYKLISLDKEGKRTNEDILLENIE